MSTPAETITASTEVVAELVRKAEAVKEIAGIPIIVMDREQKIEDMEKLLLRPRSVMESVNVVNVESFVAYWNRYKSANSVIFVDDKRQAITAVFDYHAAGGNPEWCRHTMRLALMKTREWEIWKGASGKRMEQTDFAEHIQDNMADIVTPDGATLLEMVTNLSSHRSAKFASNVRLDNGQVQFSYEEDIRGTATAGQVMIPQEFDLGIRPFLRCEMYSVGARLRYRINEERKLVIWYELKRPDRIEVDAFDGVVSELGSKLTPDVPIFFGTK